MVVVNEILKARPEYIKRLLFAISLLLFSISVGIIGFMAIEGFSLLNAIYMTIITISTVGFKEVQPISDSGKIFTSFLILTNIGIFTYSISVIASFLIEGQVRNAFKDLRTHNKLKRVKDHVIVCGFGRNGLEAANELEQHKQKFVIIDNDQSKIEQLRNLQRFPYIEGDATRDEVLKSAGIEKAKALISALPKDSDNVYVALTAKGLNPTLNVVCRASDVQSEAKLTRAGATHVIMPDRIGGNYMANMVMRPDIVEFFKVLSGPEGASLFFEELTMKELQEDLREKTIKDLDIRKITGANIIGLKTTTGTYIINPPPDYVVGECAKMIVLGDESQIEKFKKFILKNS